MNTATDARIDAIAEACVDDMGDIFWDFDPVRDAARQYAEPRSAAFKAVKKAMGELIEQFGTSLVYPASLREEYQTLVAELPEAPTDLALIGALVANAAWTQRGAQEVVQLARRYGCSILRNALALAEAMEIEDGDAGVLIGPIPLPRCGKPIIHARIIRPSKAF